MRETAFHLRSFRDADADAVLRLNAESVALLSPLDPPRLRELLSMASLKLVSIDHEGLVVGVLIGMDDGQPYDSANYRWFADRYDRFTYIDRVIVATTNRGSGIAGTFYERAEAHARSRGATRLVCEVDVDPPNAASLAFHGRRGFEEVGRQTYGTANKVVAMFSRALR